MLLFQCLYQASLASWFTFQHSTAKSRVYTRSLYIYNDTIPVVPQNIWYPLNNHVYSIDISSCYNKSRLSYHNQNIAFCGLNNLDVYGSL